MYGEAHQLCRRGAFIPEVAAFMARQGCVRMGEREREEIREVKKNYGFFRPERIDSQQSVPNPYLFHSL
jgi:hypothetical protein